MGSGDGAWGERGEVFSDVNGSGGGGGGGGGGG